ncbi:MAG: hypothetical protein DYG98_06060 [Haliscomenobacteraceae bacterium CHB4]|nr:hypothetical protein [Saprospiraceae bacterium]MCE7922599.1 hypothetical protein [Haliscomenobacteraceae bacterium CHB4]
MRRPDFRLQCQKTNVAKSNVKSPVSLTMSNIRCVLLLLSLLASSALSAQKEEKPEKAIKMVINNFFAGMEKGDTTLLRSACTADPVFQTFMANQEGKMQVYTEDFDEFVRFVGTPTKENFKEEIEFKAIHAEKSLASVWTPYKFYRNGKISHCGTNSFQLVKTDEGWKIQYIIDTRRRGCKD